jgi:hypothetical protein
MPQEVIYYAIVGGDRTIDNPYGLARRLHHADGAEDECLLRDLTWDDTPVIVEWEHGDFADELIKVSEERAGKIIEYFRAKWGSER